MGIDSGNMRFDEFLGKRSEPSFGFPLVRGGTPKFRSRITSKEGVEDRSMLGNLYFLDLPSVNRLDWLREWKDCVLQGSYTSLVSLITTGLPKCHLLPHYDIDWWVTVMRRQILNADRPMQLGWCCSLTVVEFPELQHQDTASQTIGHSLAPRRSSPFELRESPNEACLEHLGA